MTLRRAVLDAAVSALVLAFTVGALLGAMLVLFGCSSPTAPTREYAPFAPLQSIDRKEWTP